MSEPEQIDVATEIRRLRAVAKRLLEFKTDAPGAAADLELLKKVAQFALDRLKARRGFHYIPSSERRALADAKNKERLAERDKAFLEEYAAIVEELDQKRPAIYQVASALNRRMNIKPMRTEKWSDETVRKILFRLKLREKP